jgi:beta-glucanase (GH16 family)
MQRKWRFLFSTLVLSGLMLSSIGTNSAQGPLPPTPPVAHAEMVDPAWTMIWSDEFNDSIVNPGIWNCEVGGGGWGNNELEHYTCNNASIQNGKLVIEARQENMGGYQYTSSRMTTQGKREFTYGKIEASIALPSGQGLWPAFWMLGSDIGSVGWPASGEIDIMEHINTDNKVNGTIHWDAGGHADYGCSSNDVLPGLDVTQYHVYDIVWETDKITWHVDGIEYCHVVISNNINSTEEFHRPFFILLNLAVGGNWPGSPDDGTIFPAKMYVDYIHVYARTATFADVPYTHWAWSEIERLYAAGITTGCSLNPLAYCPERSVTRAEMAVFIERGIHGSTYIPPAGTGAVFADVPLSYWDTDWIEQLFADHITSGCVLSPLTYCADDPVTRAQMAKFLLKAEHGANYNPPAAAGIFADVPTTYWDASWIEQLYAEGITGGCSLSPLSYCPESPVTRAEMAKFLVLTFNLP